LSIDLPTADEPAGNLDTEEAGLWLRFFVARALRKKPSAQQKSPPAWPTG
jgi:hypothetical protein